MSVSTDDMNAVGPVVDPGYWSAPVLLTDDTTVVSPKNKNGFTFVPNAPLPAILEVQSSKRPLMVPSLNDEFVDQVSEDAGWESLPTKGLFWYNPDISTIEYAVGESVLKKLTANAI